MALIEINQMKLTYLLKMCSVSETN